MKTNSIINTLFALAFMAVFAAPATAAPKMLYVKNTHSADAFVWVDGEPQGLAPAGRVSYMPQEGFVTRDSGLTAEGENIVKHAFGGWKYKEFVTIEAASWTEVSTDTGETKRELIVWKIPNVGSWKGSAAVTLGSSVEVSDLDVENAVKMTKGNPPQDLRNAIPNARNSPPETLKNNAAASRPPAQVTIRWTGEGEVGATDSSPWLGTWETFATVRSNGEGRWEKERQFLNITKANNEDVAYSVLYKEESFWPEDEGTSSTFTHIPGEYRSNGHLLKEASIKKVDESEDGRLLTIQVIHNKNREHPQNIKDSNKYRDFKWSYEQEIRFVIAKDGSRVFRFKRWPDDIAIPVASVNDADQFGKGPGVLPALYDGGPLRIIALDKIDEDNK